MEEELKGLLGKDTYTFEEFTEIIKYLRSENGCPWDRTQTHESLKTCLLEECYEAIDAINKKDFNNLKEELGDILLQVVMNSVIAKEEKEFTLDEVVTEISKKMIHRHPHVFGEVEVANAKEVMKNWEEIKKKEKMEEKASDGLQRIATALPALIRAQKIQKKTEKSGIKSYNVENMIERLQKLLEEIALSYQKDRDSDQEKSMETFLFLTADLSRKLGINAENSLTNATDKFINRFIGVERLAEGEGKHLNEISNEDIDALWG